MTASYDDGMKKFHQENLYKGFSLLETTITLSLLSIMLISVTQIEIFSFSACYLVYQESIVITQLFSMHNRLKVNYSGLQQELIEWNHLNAALLPKGEGSLICSGEVCQIKICWQYQGKRCLSHPTAIKNTSNRVSLS